MSHSLATIVIGGSAGALDALGVILPALPAGFALPIVIGLHLLPGRPSGLAAVLAHHSPLPVKEAEDKELILPGTVYLVSPNYHLLIERQGHFSLSVDELVNFSRPSIDVLFESAADAYGSRLAGVLLSGANDDGARGLARIRAAGGLTIVQTPETAASSAMPAAAVRCGAAAEVLALEAIGPRLVALASAHRAASSFNVKETG
jgi:two-component system chemotaxis response regulator CheB